MPVVFPMTGVSSNKQEGSEGSKKGKIEGKEVCYFPIPGHVAVLHPIIDKISVTYQIADQDLKGAVIECLKLAVEEKGPFDAAQTFKSGAVTYEASVNLLVPPDNEKVLIQAGPQKIGLAHNLRLEFNPKLLGLNGIAFLKSQLEGLLVDGLSFTHIMLQGTVTRLDIAVDLVGIRIDDLDIRFFAGGKSHWYFGPSGKPETGYLGMKKSDKAAAWIAYDKRKHLKDTKGPTQQQLYGGLPHTRIEFHAKPMKPLPALNAMANPFTSLSLAYPTAPNGVKPHAWRFFLDACHRRGHAQALTMIPAGALRQRYEKALESAHTKFWKPHVIWAAWDDALLSSGLLQ